MISENDLLRIKHRFDDYVSSFYTGDKTYDAALRIKESHTKNVALEILQIADFLNAGVEQYYMAEIVAMLHDIGRFEQFARYGTYRDSLSAGMQAKPFVRCRRSSLCVKARAPRPPHQDGNPEK